MTFCFEAAELINFSELWSRSLVHEALQSEVPQQMQKELLLNSVPFGTHVPNPFNVPVLGFLSVAPERPRHARLAHLLWHVHEEMELWIHAAPCGEVMVH